MTTRSVDCSAIPWTTRDVWKAVLSILFLSLLPLVLIVANHFVHILSSLKITYGFLSAIMELLLLTPVWWFAIRKYGVSLSILGLRKSSARAIPLGCGLLIAAYFFNPLYSAILALFHLKMHSNLVSLLAKTHAPWWYFVGGVLAAPLAEEIFWRGFIFAGFRQRYGWQKAAVISAGLFALFHLNPIGFIPVFILGYIFAYLYQRSDSIWPSILMHATNNAIALIAAFLLATQGRS